jgi:hypothetical protein
VPDRSKEEYSHRLPHCLPAGKGILFTITRQTLDLQPRVAVMESTTRKWRVLLEDAADARYVATGHLAFLRQGMLMVIPFNLDNLELTGQPVPAIANVMQSLNTANGDWRDTIEIRSAGDIPDTAKDAPSGHRASSRSYRGGVFSDC